MRKYLRICLVFSQLVGNGVNPLAQYACKCVSRSMAQQSIFSFLLGKCPV